MPARPIEQTFSAAAATIALAVPAAVLTAGLIGDLVAVIEGQSLDADGFIDWAIRAGILTLAFAIGAVLRNRYAFGGRAGATEFNSALETGRIPADADTTGWMWQLEFEAKQATLWLMVVAAALSLPLGAIAGTRVPSVTPYAIATILAAAALLGVTLPGQRDRRLRSARLRQALVRAERQSASSGV